MVRFSKLSPDGRESDVRVIKQSDMLRCPHAIMMAEHYRADGTCKCDDPQETIMREWGYRWNRKARGVEMSTQEALETVIAAARAYAQIRSDDEDASAEEQQETAAIWDAIELLTRG